MTKTALTNEQALQQIAELEAHLAAAQARVAELEAQRAMVPSLRASDPSARLNTLLAVCAALLATHDLEAIMHLVVHEAAPLFPGTSGVLLYLFDSAKQQLVLRAASCGSIADLRIDPGQSVAGRAYLAPRAMLLIGPELELALSELDHDQTAQIQQLLDAWPPSSALVAPLRVERHRMGALALYSDVHAHLFHPRDLPFIQALADLTAAAIDESRQRAKAAALQRDLARTRSMHAEAKARLDTAQAQLLQSAKLAAVGELSASVAHEINNPLYAARNSLYLIEQDLPSDSPQRAFLEIAQNELGRIARIITRMRDFYRPARAELTPTSINDLLKETVELVHTHLRHSHVTVTNDLDPNLPLITAHGDQLRQVFLNIVLNACDAMPNGGELEVQTHYLNSTNEQLPTIMVQIADTGAGVPPEHLPYLFEPFYTTKPQGTGLGLAISAHIITQHEGQISVESTTGIGTTFTITLPVKE
jgi:two-component system NtrC family sensor kinase